MGLIFWIFLYKFGKGIIYLGNFRDLEKYVFVFSFLRKYLGKINYGFLLFLV